MDKWHSLCQGKAPYFPKNAVSCEMPPDDGPIEKGTVAPSSPNCIILLMQRLVSTWHYRFSRDVLADMAELLCSVDVIPYSEVAKLDAKLQAFAPHAGVFDANVRPPPEERTIISGQTRADEEPYVTLFTKQSGKAFVCPSAPLRF